MVVADETSRDEPLQSIRGLTQIILDRLDNGTRDKMIDNTQARLLGGIALRINCKSWFGEEDVAKGSLAQSDG